MAVLAEVIWGEGNMKKEKINGGKYDRRRAKREIQGRSEVKRKNAQGKNTGINFSVLQERKYATC